MTNKDSAEGLLREKLMRLYENWRQGENRPIDSHWAAMSILSALNPPSADEKLPQSHVVVPVEPGWYWLGDNDGVRIVQVFKRPGHEYLAISAETPLGGKRDFHAVNKMSGATWFGPIQEPAMLRAAQEARNHD